MDVRAWGRWWRITGRPAVVHLLWIEWDPIGLREMGGPPNEYECAADPVGGALRTGANATQITAVLASQREHLGLRPDGAADAHAADAIVTWYAAASNDGRAE